MLLGSFALPGGASACGCGEFNGPVVAHGSSEYGVPWRVKLVETTPRGPEGRRATFEFSIGRKGEFPESGGFTNLPVAAFHHFFATATPGSDIDDHPEADISGMVQARAATLEVELSDGSSVKVAPQRAPQRLLERYRWLRAARFFDVYFPDSLEAIGLAAYDRAGNLIERGDGLFLALPD